MCMCVMSASVHDCADSDSCLTANLVILSRSFVLILYAGIQCSGYLGCKVLQDLILVFACRGCVYVAQLHHECFMKLT